MEKILVIKICKNCGREFSVKRKVDKFGNIKSFKGERNFCSSFCSHKRVLSNESKAKISKKLKGNIPVNKGIHIVNKCKGCGVEIKHNNKSGLCKLCLHKSTDYRNKISAATKGKCGGLRQGSSRAYSGWYKGYWCDSSWELAFVMYCLDHNIKIARNYKGFEYQFEGQTYKYYPDFIMEDGSYTEIKGYMGKQNKEKILQFPYRLNLLVKSDMQTYIIYAKEKYGTNYVSLYDEYKPKYTHICKNCEETFENNKANSIFCSRLCAGKHNHGVLV